ncbi:MAG: hypothetical protein R6V19_16305 [Armatimonadota bacterium]
MPGFDGTGPGGMGPMTGGGRGFCNPAGTAYGGYGGYGGFGYGSSMYPWTGGAWGMPVNTWGYNRFASPYSGYGGYGYPYGGWRAPMWGGGYMRPFYGYGRGLGPCGMGMAWGRRGGWGRGRW